MLQSPLAPPSRVPWGRVSVLLACASAAHRAWHRGRATKSPCVMNDRLAQSMSSSWSKPCLNCLELPDRTGLLLLHLDCELVQPREESSLPAPERPWRPPKHLSPGNVGVGGRSLPSFVFLRLFSNRDRLWQAVASEDMISLWGGGSVCRHS